MPGDNIGEKIQHFTEKEQAMIRKNLAQVLQHKVDPNAPILDTFMAKRQDTMKDDINQTDIGVSLYVRPNGDVELFFNPVNHNADPEK